MIEFSRHEPFYTALSFASILIFALALPVFLRGRRVARATGLSRVGLWLWLITMGTRLWLEGHGLGPMQVANNAFWAATVGLAHVVMLRFVPMPDSCRSWRGKFQRYGRRSSLWGTD